MVLEVEIVKITNCITVEDIVNSVLADAGRALLSSHCGAAPAKWLSSQEYTSQHLYLGEAMGLVLANGMSRSEVCQF